METFDFPNYAYTTKYPESSFRMQLGRSWTYVEKPKAPDQRVFELTFGSMQYVEDGVGGIDIVSNPENNLGRLEDFYNRHKLYEKFILPHPIYGSIIVRFNKPLETPKGKKGGKGWTEQVTIELIEQP